ncbi:uncharacterized protein BT62DRAFT_308919 [Guyanagaster necrorhizus]|uniref:Secreted protein n=1 Tax=Guyanagaster necrorhizus TaxID=856835 RepID=A0A9P7VMN8_9AGAR|nr:uncharacterized protein BT62DRAFT_308919 [Guyanagaster necrorhizus MCA 3950]KAG7444013.1 hypothetical protein BT62DRAFT_308919 [Guyanagaster necrorhizus MCA 3950]
MANARSFQLHVLLLVRVYALGIHCERITNGVSQRMCENQRVHLGDCSFPCSKSQLMLISHLQHSHVNLAITHCAWSSAKGDHGFNIPLIMTLSFTKE